MAEFIPCLCVYTGFGVYICIQNEWGGGYQRYIPFLKNKAKRLLIPYAFVAVVWVVPISQYFNYFSIGDIFKQYVLCINPSQLWFLWMLFWIFALAWPLWKCLSGPPLKCILVSLIFYGIGLIGGVLIPNVFCIWTALQYVPFFCIGIQIWTQQKKKAQFTNQDNRHEVKLWIDRIPTMCWILLDLILFYTYLLSRQEHIPIPGVTVIIRFALNIVGSVMAFIVLQKIAVIVRWKNMKVFKKLSECSMPMYLFHQQIIYFTILLFNGRVNPYFNAVLNFLIAVALSMLISAILMKFKITRLLVGEKRLGV